MLLKFDVDNTEIISLWWCRHGAHVADIDRIVTYLRKINIGDLIQYNCRNGKGYVGAFLGWMLSPDIIRNKSDNSWNYGVAHILEPTSQSVQMINVNLK